ncbi:hypothetical protein NMY22_g8497 [Coprinellus aureogranulatus]|nr:hypothetical protein NMY22_g8497 [Coprinellus aureogranulatus]
MPDFDGSNKENAPPVPSSPTRAPTTLPFLPTTPRKRKPNAKTRTQGLRNDEYASLSIPELGELVKKLLKLSFTPDDWQLNVIHRVLKGYDSVLCAGTGYGKSVIFEALAAIGVATGKAVMVICPIKALEYDQARQASEKGLSAIVINEDTSRTVGLWEAARKTASIIYLSPEMALSDSFAKLWKDDKFRKR